MGNTQNFKMKNTTANKTWRDRRTDRKTDQ